MAVCELSRDFGTWGPGCLAVISVLEVLAAAIPKLSWILHNCAGYEEAALLTASHGDVDAPEERLLTQTHGSMDCF